MSQSSGEKTEQPTPKKLRDARKKGQVARSQELVTALSLFGVIAGLWLAGPIAFEQMVGMLDVVAMLAARPSDGTGGTVMEAIGVMFRIGSLIVLPVLGVAILIGVAANYLQFGTVFSMENVKPKLEKVSPGKGFKRIFSMKQVVETIKSIIKIVFLSILLFYVVRAAIGPYITSVHCGMGCILQVTVQMLLLTFAATALVFTIVAVADFAYQKKTHIKGLMMTKDEVKREYKESEGDPVVKGQRKQLAQELVMSDQVGQARTASAVVVNPTHLAVAIRYTEGDTPLPLVVAKGRNLNAAAIRAAAEESGVPVFRHRPLARQLFADVAVGEFVPDDTFDIVAEVLGWVERNRDTLYGGRAGSGVIDMETGDHKADRTEI